MKRGANFSGIRKYAVQGSAVLRKHQRSQNDWSSSFRAVRWSKWTCKSAKIKLAVPYVSWICKWTRSIVKTIRRRMGLGRRFSVWCNRHLAKNISVHRPVLSWKALKTSGSVIIETQEYTGTINSALCRYYACRYAGTSGVISSVSWPASHSSETLRTHKRNQSLFYTWQINKERNEMPAINEPFSFPHLSWVTVICNLPTPLRNYFVFRVKWHDRILFTNNR